MTGANSLRVFQTDAGKSRFLSVYDDRIRAWPVPCEELDLPTRFGTTHVIASGAPEAPPLFLLPAMMAGATVWRANVETLSRHFRVYAVDVIGEPNKSQPTRRILSRRGYAEWFGDVLDTLRIGRASIVGNSYGGFLAMNQASLTPDRVSRIVLLSPAATFAPIWAFYRQIFRSSFFAWIANGVVIDPLDANWGDLVNLARIEGRPVNIVPPRVLRRSELRNIRVPTLLLIGDKEVIYEPQSTIVRALERMPGLVAAIVPGANHMTALTKPDDVNARMVEFLSGSSGSSGCRGTRTLRGASP
jgi:pimeloyl-ACP methyl ester carboxylesterase